MKKTVLAYSLAIAILAFALQWLEYKHAVRGLSTELYILVIALFFTAMGIWVGNRLTNSAVTPPAFEQNRRAMDTLGISQREFEVLELLAEGHSNKEIASRLFVSLNTIKTHLGHLYSKLEVSRRTQAVQKARHLRIIP